MKISDLPTPSLILDRAKLEQNIKRMATTAHTRGIQLRPHMKTAKSMDVARLVLDGQKGCIAVSTLKEAQYFAENGIHDIQYAVGIVPDKLSRIAEIQKTGATIIVITDSLDVARAIVQKSDELSADFHVQIEIDCGEGRSGVLPDSDEVLEIARTIEQAPRTQFAGVMSHAGNSYGCRSLAEVEEVAEAERLAAVGAAERIREIGIACPHVSVGSTPTALHGPSVEGLTEIRPGVYMFGDMFQAQIGSCAVSDLAVSVLTEVNSHKPSHNRLLVDAGALALSKDRSTEAVANDIGFGLVAQMNGEPYQPQLHVANVYQEHGQIPMVNGVSLSDLPIGTRLRIFPNHVCMTAAMYETYHVVDSRQGDSQEIIEIWSRINGW